MIVAAVLCAVGIALRPAITLLAAHSERWRNILGGYTGSFLFALLVNIILLWMAVFASKAETLRQFIVTFALSRCRFKHLGISALMGCAAGVLFAALYRLEFPKHTQSISLGSVGLQMMVA